MSQPFCTQCGTRLPVEGNFCPQCGAPATRPPAQPADAPDAGQAGRRRPSSAGRRLLRFGLAALVVGVLLGAPVYYWGIRPSLTATRPDAAVDAPSAMRAALPDVHDEQGIPFPEVPRLPLADAKVRFDAGGALFVDVRDRDSYAAGHIPNSLSLPLGEIEARAAELPTDAELLTYCT